MPPARKIELTPDGRRGLRCSKCGAVKAMAGFPDSKRGPHFKGSHCKRCLADGSREYMRRRRREDPEFVARNRAATGRERKAANRAFIDELRASPCSACGRSYDPRIMQFHHRDPSEKRMTVAAAVNRSRGVLEAEIAKCELLCPTCHALADLEA